MAERLFAAKGFDGASVSEIARAARVNKALIYYHFRNKDDLVLELFQGIVAEVAARVAARARAAGPEQGLLHEIAEEIAFLSERRRIVSVMLAEAFRSDERAGFLFRCAEIAIRLEHPDGEGADGGRAGARLASLGMVSEFFTGFLPLVAFVALRAKWCGHFGGTPEQVTRDFVQAFAATHVESHLKRGR